MTIKTISPHTPVQYVMGQTKFCGLDLFVDENVFIPRPETETLVQAALEMIGSRVSGNGSRVTGNGVRILDLCTGSGCIAVSLASKLWTNGRPDCTIVACDISDGALMIAQQNALRHGVSDRIRFLRSDLFESVDGTFDLIVTNPPYVAGYEFVELQEEVLKEPRIALDGGSDGLAFYRRIIPQAAGRLRPEGYLVMEIGYDQADQIEAIIGDTENIALIEVRPDQYGIERVVVAKEFYTKNG